MDPNHDDEGFVDDLTCSMCNLEATHKVYKTKDNLIASLTPYSCNDCLPLIAEHEHLYSEEL